MDTTLVLRHSNGKSIRATKELDYFCANDLEDFLGLGRLNTRSMNTCKIKVLDRGGRRTQGKVFVHKHHVPPLLLRSKRTTKVSWLQDILLGPQEPETKQPSPKANLSPKANPQLPESNVKRQIKEVIENWWTRIPRQACEQLEEAVGLEGLYRSLHDEDMRLRREYNEKKNAAKL